MWMGLNLHFYTVLNVALRLSSLNILKHCFSSEKHHLIPKGFSE